MEYCSTKSDDKANEGFTMQKVHRSVLCLLHHKDGVVKLYFIKPLIH